MKKTILFALAGFLACFCLLADASAQVRGNYSRRDVSTTVRNLENSSDVFSREFRRQMDRNRRSGDEQFSGVVDNFENAVDRLRRNFDRNNDWWESRSDVQSIMDEASRVNAMMNQLRFARQLEVQWRNMRRDINALARTYSLPELGGINAGYPGGYPNNGYPNNNYPNNGNWNTVRPPSWAVGTFYGISPQDGSRIMLTIDQNGSISAQTGGSMSYGNYTRNNMIYINGYTSRISRTSAGIRTVSTTDGQTIDYSRGGWAGGPGYPNYPEAGGGVPNWAVGSYVGRDPMSGRTVYLVINDNGSVSVNVGGGNSYGTLSGTLMNVNGATSTISRTRNGIRTTSNTDGQTIDYRRQ